MAVTDADYPPLCGQPCDGCRLRGASDPGPCCGDAGHEPYDEVPGPHACGYCEGTDWDAWQEMIRAVDGVTAFFKAFAVGPNTPR